MPGLTLGPDPLQLALAFLVTGEANKQKVWNELVSFRLSAKYTDKE